MTMKNIKVKSIKNISEIVKGEVNIPSDKSITHRAFMLASICEGKSYIKNPLLAEDCKNTLKALGELGIRYEFVGKDVLVYGNGINNFKSPQNNKKHAYLGNSGTGIRLMTGLVCGQEGLDVVFLGDESLNKRPMERIKIPLEKMGAEIMLSNSKYPPLLIKGKKLRGIKYVLPMASAQVKSAILLAGLTADGQTEITEPEHSRNHTENMFKYLGIDIKIDGNRIILNPPKQQIKAKDFFVPGDISSAAFFMVFGVLCSENGLLIKNVGLNPTRTGIVDVLKRMGANIETKNEQNISGEIVGDIFVKKSELKGIEIKGAEIPNIIDEIPIISLAAVFAKGKTVIKDAIELRYKESDRISVVKNEFSKFGANIEELEDGLVINGRDVEKLKGAKVSTHYDHRIAMCEVIAGLIIDGETEIDDISCINTSFPTFFDCLRQVGVET